ncbi:GNAT family N-acetyltransferase [Aerophototrophica crusticola]|uniref:GNAT family N-acetyltransferase n=1 Tax=Aerophototrophica crusticola TaxID=1709002 RepID=A0A858R8Y6_9PROT|nr:GNAT family N-acetyltransferase [Rhodospirillaceae bacterium B3]
MDLAEIARLEDLALTAWPAPLTLLHDGWQVRAGGGHTGRANSVNIVGPGCLPVAGKVDVAEGFYRAHGLPPCFRQTPLFPAGLVGELDRRGYRHYQPSLVLTLGELPQAAPDPEVRVGRRWDEGWLDGYRTLVPIPERELPWLHRILSAIPVPAIYAGLVLEGTLVATAMAVVDRGWVGLYKVVTHPDFRGRGMARRLLTALLVEARTQGATGAYLQVAAGNGPAVALYRGLGFREAYGYVYRVM